MVRVVVRGGQGRGYYSFLVLELGLQLLLITGGRLDGSHVQGARGMDLECGGRSKLDGDRSIIISSEAMLGCCFYARMYGICNAAFIILLK